MTWLAKMAEVRARHEDGFVRAFHCPIAPYWSNITGFDVVAFDHTVVPGAGATVDKVGGRFGPGATALLLAILADEERAMISTPAGEEK